MRVRYLVPALLLLAAGGVAVWLLLGDRGPDLPPWTPDQQAAADASNRFAFDLYAKLRPQPGNLFVNPTSIHANLTAAADRAAGTTRAELLAALHAPPTGAVGDLAAYYSAPRAGFDLKMASAAWGEKATPWKADFLARTPHFRTADFRGNAAGERDAINRWVSDATGGRIPDLLPPAAVGPDTRFVAADAVFFRAAWKVKFAPPNTRPRPFTRADGTTVETPMMAFDRDYFLRATRGVGYEAVELPYRGDELSFVAILPEKPDGLPELEAKLSAETVAGWVAQLRPTKIQVVLPKFRHEWRPAPDGDLSPTLRRLGIRAAFDPAAADFSPMTADPLFLSGVRHAAVIEVNEEGTTAAAATSDGSKSAAGLFVADHPFLYLIRDTKRGTILFLGRFDTP